MKYGVLVFAVFLTSVVSVSEVAAKPGKELVTRNANGVRKRKKWVVPAAVAAAVLLAGAGVGGYLYHKRKKQSSPAGFDLVPPVGSGQVAAPASPVSDHTLLPPPMGPIHVVPDESGSDSGIILRKIDESTEVKSISDFGFTDHALNSMHNFMLSFSHSFCPIKCAKIILNSYGYENEVCVFYDAVGRHCWFNGNGEKIHFSFAPKNVTISCKFESDNIISGLREVLAQRRSQGPDQESSPTPNPLAVPRSPAVPALGSLPAPVAAPTPFTVSEAKQALLRPQPVNDSHFCSLPTGLLMAHAPQKLQEINNVFKDFSTEMSSIKDKHSAYLDSLKIMMSALEERPFTPDCFFVFLKPGKGRFAVFVEEKGDSFYACPLNSGLTFDDFFSEEKPPYVTFAYKAQKDSSGKKEDLLGELDRVLAERVEAK